MTNSLGTHRFDYTTPFEDRQTWDRVWIVVVDAAVVEPGRLSPSLTSTISEFGR